MRPRDPEKQKVIRENALKIFFEQGFGGFSMQKLAKASGVSPATLYIYYKDRDDLIIQLCREETRKQNSAALEGFDPGMPFAEGLKILWLNRAHYAMENPLEVHFIEQVRYTPFYEEALKSNDINFSEIMREFSMNSIKKKELVKLPVEVYWSVAFAPLYQLLKMDLHKMGFPTMRRFDFDEKMMMQTLELVLKALRP